jgi:hypothetical protein
LLLPATEILAATGLDYTFAGDYDYSIFKALREDATGVATPATYDYDYGQLQAIPQSAVTTGSTATNLDNAAGRCDEIHTMARRSSADITFTRGLVRVLIALMLSSTSKLHSIYVSNFACRCLTFVRVCYAGVLPLPA